MPYDASWAQTDAISASPAEYRFSEPFPRPCTSPYSSSSRINCGVRT